MKYSHVFLTVLTIFFIVSLVTFPQPLLQQAITSVDLWFHLVLPSLFPFLVATGILIRLGIAEVFGKLLQPIMQPIFGVSGVCAFPFFLGLLSGYPAGAKMTVTLRQQNTISTGDAQRVLAFCNNPGPLFVIGTAGTAFLQYPALGYFMMVSIFFGAIATGLLLRFLLPSPSTVSKKSISPKIQQPLPLGKLLGASIADAMETVTQIGGFIILFGVLLEALDQTGILLFLLHFFTDSFPLSQDFLYGIFGGILEMTTGASLVSQAPDSLHYKVTAITVLLSFGGLSILAQTLGILAPISVSSLKYICYKLCNAFFSGIFAFFCFPLCWQKLQKAVSVGSFPTKTAFSPDFFQFCSFLFLTFALLCIVFFPAEKKR